MKPPGKKNRYNSLQEVSFDSAIQVRPDILWREVEEEVVLLDPKHGHYYGIEGAGTRIWQLLQERTTLRKVLHCLLEEYDAGERQLRQDLVEICHEFERFGLLKNI